MSLLQLRLARQSSVAMSLLQLRHESNDTALAKLIALSTRHESNMRHVSHVGMLWNGDRLPSDAALLCGLIGDCSRGSLLVYRVGTGLRAPSLLQEPL